MADLNIAEIPYPSGIVQFRYTRELSADGTRWIRHGLFRAYHEDGSLASEGNYVRGVEHGLWRDCHPNGQITAEGHFIEGTEANGWRYWSPEGTEEFDGS